MSSITPEFTIAIGIQQINENELCVLVKLLLLKKIVQFQQFSLRGFYFYVQFLCTIFKFNQIIIKKLIII